MADERNRRRSEPDFDPRRDDPRRFGRDFDDDYGRYGHSSDAERMRTEWHREDLGRDVREAGSDLYGRRDYPGHARSHRQGGDPGPRTWGDGRDRWGRDVYPGDTGADRFPEDRGRRDTYGRDLYPDNSSREGYGYAPGRERGYGGYTGETYGATGEYGQDIGQHRGRGPRDYKRSDARILEDVCDRLTDDGHVDASDIQVSVNACEVTLSGSVRDRAQKRRAEDLAEAVSGVRNVQNSLRVADTAADRADEMSDTVTRQSGLGGRSH